MALFTRVQGFTHYLISVLTTQKSGKDSVLIGTSQVLKVTYNIIVSKRSYSVSELCLLLFRNTNLQGDVLRSSCPSFFTICSCCSGMFVNSLQSW